MNKGKIGLILLGLVGVALLLSAIGKIVGAEEAAATFGKPQAPYILAAIEFICLAALLAPKTRMLGIILSASYFGGAIAFSWLGENELPIAGIVVSIVLYVGAYLYRPTLSDGAPAKAA